MLTCDDDIPSPINIRRCATFLDSNPSYVGATGEYPWVDYDLLSNKDPYHTTTPNYIFLNGRRKGLNPSFSIKGTDIQDRFTEVLDNKLFHTMFCVMRSNCLSMLCNPYMDSMHTPLLAGEYQWMFVRSRVLKFPYPHVIRIFHGKIYQYRILTILMKNLPPHYSQIIGIKMLNYSLN